MICKNGNYRGFSLRSETGGVCSINYCATRKDVPKGIRIKGNRKMFPVQKIRADCMTPMHRTPNSAVGIVLIKEMILTVEIHKSIGIIHPVCLGGKMILGTVFFLVIG